MNRNAWLTLAVGVAVGVGFSESPDRSILPGSPLPGITPAEFEMFRLGREDFT